MTYRPQVLRFAGISVAAGLATLLSYEKLDRPVALFFARQLQVHPRWAQVTAGIPDLLPALVAAATAVLFLLAILGRTRLPPQHRHFLRTAAVAVPLSYLLKSFLQYFFGRIGTRLWLEQGGYSGFHWFTHFSDFRNFPSGHMAVAAALFAVVWWSYPHLRRAVAAALLLLGVALVATDYHFLSDVIAGAYVGFFAALATRQIIPPPSGD